MCSTYRSLATTRIISRSVRRRVIAEDTVTFEMDDPHFPFEIDVYHRVIICLTCQYAVIPSQTKTHLRVYHKRLTLQQRRNIVSKVENIAELAKDHKDVIYPQPYTPLVFGLPVYFDGLKCTETNSQGDVCSYMCRTLHLMQEHCKQKHNWVNRQKRGGDVRTKQLHTSNKIWTENHACQRFFKVGKWQRYFEVARQDAAENRERQASKKDDFFQAQANDIQQAECDAAEDADRVHGFDDHVSAVVPWLRETGIADHIRSLRKDEIRTAIAVPLPGDESELRTIIDAMEALLLDAHRLCFDGPDCMLTYQCRVVLSRFQPSQVDLTGKTRPFDPYKGPKSLAAYFGIALRFVSYFSRVVAPDEYHFSAVAEDDDDIQRPEDVIKATDEQLAVWRDIYQIAQRRRTKPTEENDEEADEEEEKEMKDRLLEL